MKNTKFIWIIAIIIVVIGASIWAFSKNQQPTAQNQETIKIGYLPLTDHLPLMVTSGNDMFEGLNVEPVKFTDWPSLVEALKAGKIDGAHIINTLAVKMVSEGFEGQAVALSHRGDIGLSVTSRNPITDVQELKGKTIAVPTRFSPHFMMLHNYLTSNGIDVDKDVTILDVAPPDFISTMASGKVDAFIGSEPFPTLAESKEIGTTFKLWDEMQIEGTNGLDCVIVFSTDFIDNSQNLVQSYVDSIIKAGLYIENNPLGAATVASPFMLNIAPELLVKAIDEPKNRSSYDSLTPVYSEFEKFQDYMIKVGLIKEPIDLKTFVNDSFAKKAYRGL